MFVFSAKGEQKYLNYTGVRPEGGTTLLSSLRRFIKCCPKTLGEVGWATKDTKKKKGKERKPGVAVPVQPNSRTRCHADSRSSNPGSSHFRVGRHLLDCWPAHVSPCTPTSTCFQLQLLLLKLWTPGPPSGGWTRNR